MSGFKITFIVTIEFLYTSLGSSLIPLAILNTSSLKLDKQKKKEYNSFFSVTNGTIIKSVPKSNINGLKLSGKCEM